KLAYVAAESGADTAEGGVKAGGQSLHARGGAESDQGNNQSVFNQILTFLAACQILELHVQLEKHRIHFVFLRVFVVASRVWIPLHGKYAFSPGGVCVAFQRR